MNQYTLVKIILQNMDKFLKKEWTYNEFLK
jgi:hypothetical protein